MIRKIWQLLGAIAFHIVIAILKISPKKMQPRTRVLVQTDANKILVVKPWLGDGRWSLPGGGVRKNESTKVAAVRELYEETGLKIDKQDCNYLGLRKYNSLNYHCFFVKLKSTPSITTPRIEIVEAAWVLKAELSSQNSHSSVVELAALTASK